MEKFQEIMKDLRDGKYDEFQREYPTSFKAFMFLAGFEVIGDVCTFWDLKHFLNLNNEELENFIPLLNHDIRKYTPFACVISHPFICIY